MRPVLAATLLSVCACLPLWANGGKIAPESEKKEAVPVELEKTLVDTTKRDKLIHYLLTHSDIPNQQALLSKLLRVKDSTSEVISLMPREHRDAFSMTRQ